MHSACYPPIDCNKRQVNLLWAKFLWTQERETGKIGGFGMANTETTKTRMEKCENQLPEVT